SIPIMRHWILIVMMLGGCARMPLLPLGPLKPYRMDIQQGNHVTQELLEEVKPGMTRRQVRYALRTPLIVDPFHMDCWYYVYYYQKAGTENEQRRIVVGFEDARLARIEGDAVAAAQGGAARDGGSRQP